MQQKKLLIINKLGLHTRAAAKFVAITNIYQSDIEIIHKDKKTSGKSIIGLMTLSACEGSEIEIIINGEDEEQLMQAVEKLIINKFNESQ